MVSQCHTQDVYQTGLGMQALFLSVSVGDAATCSFMIIVLARCTHLMNASSGSQITEFVGLQKNGTENLARLGSIAEAVCMVDRNRPLE
jgi:hypothetical protein